LLEEIAFPFHHRLARECPDVAEAEHSGTVGYDRDEVALRRVPIRVIRIPLDLETGFGDPGRVREGKVPLIRESLGRDDGDLPRAGQGVVLEGVFAVHDEERYVDGGP
jgi:hypothetical protein